MGSTIVSDVSRPLDLQEPQEKMQRTRGGRPREEGTTIDESHHVADVFGTILVDMAQEITVSSSRTRGHDETFSIRVIESLDDSQMCLTRPMWAIVVQNGVQDFIAREFRTGLAASGDTAEEAVTNLKDMVACKYRLFGSLGKKRLGPMLRKQYRQLMQLIQEH